tara:strand:+ start:339 stop:524 length:186 start_codon:yes stop_codon:yes gene_type:complete
MNGRNEVRKILLNKAEELKLDTSLANKVMGVGREIKILNDLLFENMSKSEYNILISKIKSL